VARDNFLVYCALSAFGGRPNFKNLPEDLQYDVKDLLGNYRSACAESDKLLYSIADLSAINSACNAAKFGKLTSEALYIHVDYIDLLPKLLRVYEGAARQITGDVDNATIVKLNRLKPQVSYLVYPTFEAQPHPALEASIVAKLGEIRVKYRLFGHRANRPILHRKELFVPDAHPTRKKFERLSKQEVKAGLLDRHDIGTEFVWQEVLNSAGYRLNGHRLVKS
jgi:DNA phosphorothioation-associated putative methyltransferase